MDRYQFEDLISDYLENQLPLAQRKEFEQYLEANPEGKQLVEAVRDTIRSLKTLPGVPSSPQFMTNLYQHLEGERMSHWSAISGRTIFGFKPLYAGLMATLLVAVVIVGLELLPTGSPGSDQPSQFSDQNPLPAGPAAASPANDALADKSEDSTTTDSAPKTYPLEDQIKFVKDQP